jgi:hypothetical protein
MGNALLKHVLLLLICLLTNVNSCWAIISGISFSQKDQNTTNVSVVTNEPINFQVTPESDEIVVLGGFRFSDWKAPLEGNAQGAVVDYFVEEYEDGSAELVLHTKPGARVLGGKFNMNGSVPQYDILIEGPTGTPLQGEGIAVVSDVQVGKKGPYTRVVFGMNDSVDFDVKYNEEGDKIAFTPKTRVKWAAPTSDKKQLGSFGGYYLVDLGNKIGVILVVRPGTKVARGMVINAQTPAPKYVIDLAPASMASMENQLFDDGLNQGDQNNLNNSWGAVGGENNFSQTKQNQDVQSMNIFTQNDDTIINFSTKSAIEFDVTENEYTNQVTVHLPKTDWTAVEAMDKSGGLIEGYKIDQSDPKTTNITFNVQKGTNVIGSKVSSGGEGQNSRFVIHLNQNENKSPDWLVDDSIDSLPYDEAHKEEVQTSQIVYRGGVSEHASVGDGFYGGLQASYFGAEQKNNSSNTSPDSRSLRSGLTGVTGHVVFGLGKKINRFYGGGEIFVGYMGAKQVHELQADGRKDTSEVVPGFTWGAAARVGHYISAVGLLYARLGILSTDFYFRSKDTARGALIFPDSYAKRNRTGFLYAVGLEAALNDRMSVRFETGQINYQVFGHKTNLGGLNNSIEHRFIMNQLSLGIMAHLNPMTGPSAITLFEDSFVEGFYIGGSFSFHNTTEKRELDGLTTIGGSGTSTKFYTASGNTDPVWGMFAGFSNSANRFAYAGEAQVSLTDAIIEESISRDGSGFESYRDKLQWTWGLVGKAGWILNHGVTAWAKLGAVTSRFKRTPRTTGDGRYFAASKAFKKNIFGLRTGADLEVSINRMLGIRGSWTFDYYPSFIIKDSSNNIIKEKVSVMDNRFGIGLTVYLNDTLKSAGLFR